MVLYPYFSVQLLILIDESLPFWVDWVQLLDGITREKQLAIKEFFERWFPTTAKALPSIWHTDRIMQKHTGIVPQWWDCCINSCMAYTGVYEDSANTHCTYCKAPRFYSYLGQRNQQKARKRFLYIPLAPRLRRQFMTDQAKVLTSYRAAFDTRAVGDITDVFDGEIYQDLRWNQGLFNR